MADRARRFVVEILGDAKGLTRANKDAEQSALSLEQRAGKLGEAIAGAYVVDQVVNFGKRAVTAAMEDEAAQRQLAEQLRRTTGARDDEIESIEEFIAKTQNATGVLDDSLRPALGNLVRATGDATKSQELLTLALDVSTATGRDLEAVSLALGRAAGGNVSALSRLGIATKDASGQTKDFATLVGDLTTQFGGAAAANAETFAGKMSIVKANLADAEETIGEALLPVVGQLAEGIAAAAGWFNSLSPEVQSAATQVLLFGGGALALVKTLHSAREAVSGFTRAVGMSNPAMLAVVGVAAAGAAVYMALAQRKAEARERTEELTDALRDEAQGNKDAVAQALARHLADKDLIESAEELGVSVQDLAKVLRGEASPAYDEVLRLQKEMARFGGSTHDHQMDVTRVKANQLVHQVEDLAKAYDAATEAVKRETAQKELAEAVANDLGTTLEEETEETEDNTAAKQRQAEAVANVTNAMRDKVEATLASISSEIGLRNATRQSTEAIGEYDELARSGKASVDELAEAQDKAAEAALRQAAAAAKLREDQEKAEGRTLSARDAARLQREELEKVAATLAPGSPLRVQLQEYIDQLLTIPGSVTTTITGGRTGVNGGAGRGVAGVRAAGGPIIDGNTYLVGENGPELVTPDSNAHVVPVGAVASATTGGGTIIINATHGVTADEIVAKIQAYNRRNGTAWLR